MYNKILDYKNPSSLAVPYLKKIAELCNKHNWDFAEFANDVACDITCITEYMLGMRTNNGFSFNDQRGWFLSDIVIAVSYNTTRTCVFLQKELEFSIHENGYNPFEEDVIYLRPEEFEPHFGHGLRWAEVSAQPIIADWHRHVAILKGV